MIVYYIECSNLVLMFFHVYTYMYIPMCGNTFIYIFNFFSAKSVTNAFMAYWKYKTKINIFYNY